MKTIMNPGNETEEQRALDFYDDLLTLRVKFRKLEDSVTDIRAYLAEDMPFFVVDKITENDETTKLLADISDGLIVLQSELEEFEKFTNQWARDAYNSVCELTPEGYHIERVKRAKSSYRSAMCFVKDSEE
jgi:hypothetical protein